MAVVMGLGRRKVSLADANAWVFNRMADVYDARPAYPTHLLDALLDVAQRGTARVVDLGAGIGHLALPLAARGCSVVAVEPASAMLDRLRARVGQLPIQTLHAQAEHVPLADASCDLVLIADALHFMDAELTGREVARLLVPAGALAFISCEFADTPYMRAIQTLMQEAAPRRVRATAQPFAQLAACAGVRLESATEFSDETLVSPERLERILRSISFIGPAMNAQRWTNFIARVHELPEPARWARRFVLQLGRRPR